MVEQKDLLTAEDRRTLLLHLHNHLEQQLTLGETRAGLTLAAGGAFGAVLVTAATASNLLSHLSSREMILFEISALLLCVAMILAFWSVRPAWEVTRFVRWFPFRLLFNPRPSLLGFYSIESETDISYLNKFSVATNQQIDQDLIMQVYGKSTKAFHKFSDIYVSVTLICISMILFVGVSAKTVLLSTMLVPFAAQSCA